MRYFGNEKHAKGPVPERPRGEPGEPWGAGVFSGTLCWPVMGCGDPVFSREDAKRQDAPLIFVVEAVGWVMLFYGQMGM
jgi:hypothetical protein